MMTVSVAGMAYRIGGSTGLRERPDSDVVLEDELVAEGIVVGKWSKETEELDFV